MQTETLSRETIINMNDLNNENQAKTKERDKGWQEVDTQERNMNDLNNKNQTKTKEREKEWQEEHTLERKHEWPK